MDADTGDIQGTAQVEAPETYAQTHVYEDKTSLFDETINWFNPFYSKNEQREEYTSSLLTGPPAENAQELQDLGFSNQQVQEAQAQLDAGAPVTETFTAPANGFDLGGLFAGASGLILLGVVAWLALRK